MKVIPASGLLTAIALLCVACPGPQPDPVTATRRTIADIRQACNAYKLDCGTPPTEALGIRALIDSTGTPQWRGPYMQGDLPRDAWGIEFRYRLIDGKPAIDSAGPDGKFGTPDDINGG